MAEQINLNATQSRQITRSTFIPDKPFEHTFTCNTGDVVPLFMTINVLPHDTWSFKVNTMVKQQTPLHPTIGRAYQMWVAYYTPHNQIWKNWDAFMGEVKDAAWVSQTNYSVPKIEIINNIASGSLLDHLGWRIGGALVGCKLSALKIRHYLHICNEWLRDQNVEAPFYTTDETQTVTDGTVSLTGTELFGDAGITSGNSLFGGGKLYQINRKADYFSVNLPEPQRGSTEINVPIAGSIPVEITSNGESIRLTNGTDGFNIATKGVPSGSTGINYAVMGYGNARQANVPIGTTIAMPGNTGSAESVPVAQALGFSKQTGLKGTADLSTAAQFDINTFRTVARTQQIYELDARAGSRAPEMLYARWGVEVDELEMRRPRMLCADQAPISIFQVEQTSQTTSDSPQGNLAAFGQGQMSSEWNTHSFKYHGALTILFWIRTEHKYQYGVPREDLYSTRFDFWHPEFDGEGDQGTWMAEIWATADNVNNRDANIFGYNERGAELKSFPSIITGELRSDASTVYNIDGTIHGTLDTWTYADKYSEQPTLSNTWMKETPENVDRTIHVQSSEADQWLVDTSVEFKLTRAIRAHSIPGIDRV